MRICTRKADNRIIEMQEHARAGTLLANARAAGYSDADVAEREVTAAEYEALMAAQREAELTYADRRRAEYPPIGDQLDAIWKGGAAMDDMRATVMAIKARYPKPAA